MNNQVSNETQRKLEDLRYLAGQFSETLLQLTHETYHERLVISLTTLDTAIDQWNVIINRAPQVLKRAKLELLGETAKTGE